MSALIISAVVVIACVAGFAYVITHYPKNNKHNRTHNHA